MFSPPYTISHLLLSNIKRLTNLTQELNNRRFPRIILLEFEKRAQEVSAFASTSIEGNPLPLTEVKRILTSKPENARGSEKVVLNFNQALEQLQSSIESEGKSLSLNLVLDVHKQVVSGLLPKIDCGKWRQKPVVVNNPRTGKVVNLPPDHQEVADLMDDLIEYINKNSSKIDPLILAGIFHKQMLIVHFFMDGNGRTTRLATKVLLARMDLNTFNLSSFENYCNQNVTRYFQLLGEYGDYNELENTIDFTAWLEYFTEGIIDELIRISRHYRNTVIPLKQDWRITIKK